IVSDTTFVTPQAQFTLSEHASDALESVLAPPEGATTPAEDAPNWYGTDATAVPTEQTPTAEQWPPAAAGQEAGWAAVGGEANGAEQSALAAAFSPVDGSLASRFSDDLPPPSPLGLDFEAVKDDLVQIGILWLGSDDVAPIAELIRQTRASV